MFVIKVLLMVVFIGLFLLFFKDIGEIFTAIFGDVKNLRGKLIVGAMIVIGLFAVLSSAYTVDQSEYAVLTTFGKPSGEVKGSGLKFKLPYPIQSVHKMSKETFSLTFGYHQDGKEVVFNEEETKMITGDENIVLADLEVQWKIVDPVAFLYNTNKPKDIMYNAVSSSLRGIIGSSTVDDALTDGRARIINEIRDNLTELVNNYKLGIAVVNVNLQDVDLPTEEVSTAFKSVTDAREERITKVNEANKYRNEKINKVTGEQDAILSRAEGKKTTMIEKAKGDTAKFNALYSEYVNNKDVTKQRITIDTMQLILKDAKLYITDGSNNTVKYLPIDGIMKEGK